MTHNEDISSPVKTTPIRRYGIRQISRPMAAVALGVSLRTFDRMMLAYGLAGRGRVHTVFDIAELEQVVGRSITVDRWLAAYMRTHQQRRGTGQRRRSYTGATPPDAPA